jgi:rare lipoprotein A
MKAKKITQIGFGSFGFIILLFLAGCSSLYKTSNQTSLLSMNCDETNVETQIPQNLKKSSLGNPLSYEVLNQVYKPFQSLQKGYQEVGLASWYGPNFMGEKTSSGEIFDPCELTAAHRLVPIPSYFLVRNLENDREVIVKVNDRGPFVKTDERIIDLSYMAAKKLGFENKGTAQVKITSLSNHKNTNPIQAIQVGSFNHAKIAKKQKQSIEDLNKIKDDVFITFQDGIYRLIILSKNQSLNEISDILKSYKIDHFLTTIHQ